MSDVQIKTINYLLYASFEAELAQALSDGWIIIHTQVVHDYTPELQIGTQRWVAILKRGGNEPIRGQMWMLSAIEALQFKVQSMEVYVQRLQKLLDFDPDERVGINRREAAELMQEQLHKAVNEEGYLSDEDVSGWVYRDPIMEFWTPEDMKAYTHLRGLTRIDLIDAEIARDLAAGVG